MHERAYSNLFLNPVIDPQMYTMIHLAVCEKRILNPPFETLIAE